MPKTRGGRTARIMEAARLSTRGSVSSRFNKIDSKEKTEKSLLENQLGDCRDILLNSECNSSGKSQPGILKPFSTISVEPGESYNITIASTLTPPIALEELPYDEPYECINKNSFSQSSCSKLPVALSSFSRSQQQEDHGQKTVDKMHIKNSTSKSAALLQEQNGIFSDGICQFLDVLNNTSEANVDAPVVLPIYLTIEGDISPREICNEVLTSVENIENQNPQEDEKTTGQTTNERGEILKASFDEREELPNINIGDSNTNIIEDDVEKDKDYIPSGSDSDSICSNGKTNKTSNQADKEIFSDEDADPIKKPFANKKVQKRKRNKNTGKKYKTAKGKVLEARILKPLRQNCRNNCRKKLDENIRKKIFDEYWRLGTHDRRVAFVASLITAKDTKITRSKIDGRPTKNRLYTYIYHFEINGERLSVCKSCFLATLDETDKFVRCLMANKISSSSGVTHTDKRGTHTPVHKTAQYKIVEVLNHIKSFPAYESHYSRRHTEKKYLAAHLNLSTMYNLYREEHKDKPVSIKIYAREFHKLGLRFKKPKNDTCSKCDSLLAKEKYCENEEEKTTIKKELDSHLASADAAYSAKDFDKKKGIADPTHVTYAFDLQQVLQTPYLSTNNNNNNNNNKGLLFNKNNLQYK